MKKLTSLFLIIALLLTTSLSATAQENITMNNELEEVLFETEEITDINELQSRMDNNICDNENIKLKLNTDADEQLQIKIQSTNQKLRSVKSNLYDQVIDTYVCTSQVSIYDDKNSSKFIGYTPHEPSDVFFSGGPSIKYEIKVYVNVIKNSYNMDRYYDPLSCKVTLLDADDNTIDLETMTATIVADGYADYYSNGSLTPLGPRTINRSQQMTDPNTTYRNSVSAYDNTGNTYWDSETFSTFMYGAAQFKYTRIPTGGTYTIYQDFPVFGTF